MSVLETTASDTSTLPYSDALRRLYVIRAVFALIWAGLMVATSTTTGPLLTALLVIYPLFDAGAVLWQLRADPDTTRPKVTEWVNVGVSIAVAIALGGASTVSIAAVLVVWGVWAIGSGIPQLITAVRNRKSGGQVAQMLSGGISVLAGGGFLSQGLAGASDTAGVAGYATLGGFFFLVSAIRLSTVLRKPAA
ncbi:hypothetical protein AB0H42_31745 [Nocardia sp. NPDC050799]|uniref:hypothetical protein n=1 Tax=Nocardia TaxID=1817 RepID=UPI0007A76051|nr:hypothetical protein [Nocardia fusca]